MHTYNAPVLAVTACTECGMGGSGIDGVALKQYSLNALLVDRIMPKPCQFRLIFKFKNIAIDHRR